MTHDLTEQARVLADRVGALSLAVDQLDHRTNRGEKIVVAVVAVLLLTLSLSVIVSVVVLQQRDQAHDIGAAVAREAKTRQEGLCPLYGLLLGTYNPDSRAEGQARETYIEQFRVMRTAYATLECTGPLVPPSATPTPPRGGG